LIATAASTEKPLIISTGASSNEEISALLDRDFMQGVELVLLHCVSNYPPRLEDINLRCIPAMNGKFSVPVGISDHSPGISISVGAVALGAVFVEKHFTISHELDGPDQKISMEPHEFRDMICACDDVFRSLGTAEKKPAAREADFLKIARRGLYLRRSVEKGEPLSSENAVFLRPSNEISSAIVRLDGGSVWKFSRSLPAGPISMSDIEGDSE
jgi:sialic acid synthase SpsE